jgi:hypothetical protein
LARICRSFPSPSAAHIYTRKSTEHKSDLDFNSLDALRARRGIRTKVNGDPQPLARAIFERIYLAGFPAVYGRLCGEEALAAAPLARAACGWEASGVDDREEDGEANPRRPRKIPHGKTFPGQSVVELLSST